MDTRERVARKLHDVFAGGGALSFEDRTGEGREFWLAEADEIIALVREPEDGDVHFAAVEVLKNAAEFVSPGRRGEMANLAGALLDSRGAVGGAWGRQTARALLQLPQEED
jgi:hypothetical protein